MAGARTIPRTRFVVCGHRERACISPQNEEAAPALDVVDGDGYIREERTTAECKKWKNQNDDYSITPVPYVYDGAHHTPLGLFSKSDCSTSKRVPKPTDTTAKRLQRRDFFKLSRYQPWEIGREGCDVHRRVRYHRQHKAAGAEGRLGQGICRTATDTS